MQRKDKEINEVVLTRLNMERKVSESQNLKIQLELEERPSICKQHHYLKIQGICGKANEKPRRVLKHAKMVLRDPRTQRRKAYPFKSSNRPSGSKATTSSIWTSPLITRSGLQNVAKIT